MDADRFDAFARAVHPDSRRRFLGTLCGVALGTLASVFGLADTEAKGKKKKKKKKKPQCNEFAGEEPCGNGCCDRIAGNRGPCCGGLCCFEPDDFCCGKVCCPAEWICCGNSKCVQADFLC